MYSSTTKLLPRQHVSALVSHSLKPFVPGLGSQCFATFELALIFLVVTILATTVTACHPLRPPLLWDRILACSFRPPIIVVPVVTWLTSPARDTFTADTSGGIDLESCDIFDSMSLNLLSRDWYNSSIVRFSPFLYPLRSLCRARSSRSISFCCGVNCWYM